MIAFILELCKSHKSIVVYKEHSIHGELGEAITRLLMKYKHCMQICIVRNTG